MIRTALLLAITAIVAAAPAAANEAPSRAVATAGIDLNSAEGRAVVAARVRRAAASICHPGDASLRAAMARRACTAAAIAAASPQIEALAQAQSDRNKLAGVTGSDSILVR